jgi:hypothetical protein
MPLHVIFIKKKKKNVLHLSQYRVIFCVKNKKVWSQCYFAGDSIKIAKETDTKFLCLQKKQVWFQNRRAKFRRNERSLLSQRGCCPSPQQSSGISLASRDTASLLHLSHQNEHHQGVWSFVFIEAPFTYLLSNVYNPNAKRDIP